jgi:predicted AAA+ superfamily ATPase
VQIPRIYPKRRTSIMLLGPRGTGKSTFVREALKPDLTIDLLHNKTYRQLHLEPSRIEELVGHLARGQVVFVDEVQKIPELLDEVHRLIEDKGLLFVLTGSSARKLRTSGVNLLAGRAISKKMYPLTLREIGKRRPLETVLRNGGLPRAVTDNDNESVDEYLATYVETYLKEEVFQEGLTRNLANFSRFVECAGQYHGMTLNYESVARDLGVSGDTVRSWFQILIDTLVGSVLPAYPLNMERNETKHSRFYLFDAGVARAAEGLIDFFETPERRGYYFEGLILNELKAYCEVHRKNWRLFYYSAPGVGDIDFVVETRRKTMSAPARLITIEVKLAKEWKGAYEKLSLRIREKCPKQTSRSIGIYTGTRRLTRTGLEVFPLAQFLDELWDGKLEGLSSASGG